MTTAAPVGTVSKFNAPRDADKLQVLGPFVVKRLAEELGVFANEDVKKSFLREPINVRAKTVFDALLAYDAAGGAPAPAAAPPPAAAAPPPAAAPLPAAITRTPVSGMNGAAHPAPAPAAAGTGEVLAMLAKVSEMTGSLSGVLSANTAELNALRGELQASRNESATLKAQLDVMARLQHLTLGVIAQMAESALGASFKEVLEQVASEYVEYEGQIQALIAGK